MARVKWSEFWAMFNEADEETRLRLARSINIKGDFREWMKTRSAEALREILSEAPTPVLLEFIYLLPRPDAIKLAKLRPPPEWDQLSDAYKRRFIKQLGSGK